MSIVIALVPPRQHFHHRFRPENPARLRNAYAKSRMSVLTSTNALELADANIEDDMKKSLIAAALLLACGSSAQAQETKKNLWETYVERGQKAFDNQSFKNAATYWQKALTAVQTTEPPAIVATITTKLAEALAAQEKYLDADENLQRALQVYTSLGSVTPDFSRVFADVSKKFRVVTPDQFGTGGAKTLTENSAKVSVSKIPTGTHVEINAPARFVASAGSDQVDQVGFEKLVSFDLKKDSAGTTNMDNIKGFRVHLAEKNMWVNLFNLAIKGDDIEGKRDAEITAGKAGIVKTVQHKLPSKIVTPLDTLLKNAAQLDTPVALSLPVDTTPAPAAVPAPASVAPAAVPASVEPAAIAPAAVPAAAVTPTSVEPAASPAVAAPVVESPATVAVPTPTKVEENKSEAKHKVKFKDKDDDDDDDKDDKDKDEKDKD
jgi:tetratricopeptide (TPR) repeat protein